MSCDLRLAALRRFAIAITLFNILGHSFFGFEQSIAQPLVSVATAYFVEILLELVDARTQRRAPRFLGGPRVLVDFLLPSHITGLAVGMLLYANDRLLPIAFASAAAIGSKWIFRAPVGGRLRHVFNPSNFGIATTLLVFPWVGIAPPYHFTENLSGAGDWILPAVIFTSGSFLNARFTRRIPLIASWVACFALQALVRSAVLGTPWMAPLMPMTGVAFILFTFYMISDPGTTPTAPRAQALFGASVALAYGVLQALHVVFGLFFALGAVCAMRGVGLAVAARRAEQRSALRPLEEALSPAPGGATLTGSAIPAHASTVAETAVRSHAVLEKADL